MNQQLKDLLYIIDENNESDEFYETVAMKDMTDMS